MTANVTIGPGEPVRANIFVYAAGVGRPAASVECRRWRGVRAPSKFMPPNGKPYALNLVNNVIYTHSGQGCGGNPNMAYTYDLATHKVGSWGPAGGGMWGRSGPAGEQRTGHVYRHRRRPLGSGERGLYGNGIIGVKQNPETKSLELVDYYGPSQCRMAVEARPRHAGYAGHL